MRALWLASLGALASCSGAPTGGGDPEPMPTGTILAGTPNGVQRGTYLIDIASGAVTQIAQAGEPLSVAWQGGYSAARGSVIGTRAYPLPNRVRAIELASGDTTTLFEAPSIDDLTGAYAVSPSGSRLAIQTQHWPTGEITLSLIDLTTGSRTPIRDLVGGIDELPLRTIDWTPDESALFVTTDVYPDRSEVVRIDLGTQEFRIVSPTTVVDGDLDVSPDGRVVAHKDGSGRIILRGPDGVPLPQYPEIPGLVMRPTFSPDGKFLAYQELSIESGEGDIILMRLSDGKRWTLKIQADVRPWLSDWF